VKIDGARAVLTFQHIGGGLVAKGGELKGFTIAGADKVFHPAQAKIVGDTIVVSSPEVSKPAAVRYAWANVPEGNLFNRAGLPASSFRTDVD
jgi:sialate O-acetylesterase